MIEFLDCVRKSAKGALQSAVPVIRTLLCIMLPVSFAVLVLEASGALHYISLFMDPWMCFLGLPGEAALAVLSSVFINLYSAIAVITTLSLTGKQLIILANICLIAHEFFFECIVMKKTGSMLSRIVILRIMAAFFAAWVLSHIVPDSAEKSRAVINIAGFTNTGIKAGNFLPKLLFWFGKSFLMVIQVLVIVFAVMLLQRLLDELGIMKKLARVTSPLIRFFGLPANTGYVWIIAYTIGIAYGSGVLLTEVREGRISRVDADLFNHHTAISHSHLEDSLLFVSIGVPYLWAALPRLILAAAAVWLEKFRRLVFRHSFKVKVVRK